MPDGVMMQSTDKLVMGVITGAHGVRGLVRVKSFAEDPADLTAYGALTDRTGTRTFDLTLKGTVKGQLLAAVDGCADRNAADALRGQELCIDRTLLPAVEDEDEFYHADLIGLSAVDGDGQDLGHIRAVFDFGSGDMLELVGGDGRVSLVPFTRDVVPEIDLDAGRLTVLVPADAPDAVEDGEGGAP